MKRGNENEPKCNENDRTTHTVYFSIYYLMSKYTLMDNGNEIQYHTHFLTVCIDAIVI